MGLSKHRTVGVTDLPYHKSLFYMYCIVENFNNVCVIWYSYFLNYSNDYYLTYVRESFTLIRISYYSLAQVVLIDVSIVDG